LKFHSIWSVAILVSINVMAGLVPRLSGTFCA